MQIRSRWSIPSLTDFWLQILDAVKEVTEWLEENAATATTEDFEEQKEQLSSVAYPITSKLYGSAPPTEDDEEYSGHDEL